MNHPPPPPPPPVPPPHPHHPRTYVYRPAANPNLPPQHPKATTALVLGLVSIVGMFFFILPVLVSPFAWWTGARAVREIDAEPDAWSGRGLAMAGKVMGIVGTALLVLGVIGIVLLVRLLLG